MNVPSNLKYTKDHEWISISENTGIIGITDYAQSELGDVVFVDINPKLTSLEKGKNFGTIEAVKTVSDLIAPCSGKVLKINKELENVPELVNHDPYGKGWMVEIELVNQSELNDLLDSDAYSKLIGN